MSVGRTSLLFVQHVSVRAKCAHFLPETFLTAQLFIFACQPAPRPERQFKMSPKGINQRTTAGWPIRVKEVMDISAAMSEQNFPQGRQTDILASTYKHTLAAPRDEDFLWVFCFHHDKHNLTNCFACYCVPGGRLHIKDMIARAAVKEKESIFLENSLYLEPTIESV